ncbi:glycoside hydrolase family 128 protein [Xylaria nigripes]|nr:glycoside hydrolase family 128 protein [Xylaria nigripes]
MHSFLFLITTIISVVLAQTRSDKRGLIFIPNDKTPQDNAIWVQDGSDLTWYYNYAATPSPAFADNSQDEFEFVPMLWGSIDDTSFLSTVRGLMDGGRNIRHVLTFNEPDGPFQNGGSDITPSKAAQVWVDNIIPLQEQGVKVGLPACTGAPSGIPWLQAFLGNCSELISSGEEVKSCSYDFVTLHWYGNFEGLASHMGEYSAAFPNAPQWITEYNLANEDLEATQEFYNMSSEYYDRLDSVARYSYFGSFRSDVSNVGPNGAMLNNDGDLTDIGSWYLGGVATGVEPQIAMTWKNRVPMDLLVAGGILIM